MLGNSIANVGAVLELEWSEVVDYQEDHVPRVV